MQLRLDFLGPLALIFLVPVALVSACGELESLSDGRGMFLVEQSNRVDSMITVVAKSAQQYRSIIDELVFAELLAERSIVN